MADDVRGIAADRHLRVAGAVPRGGAAPGTPRWGVGYELDPRCLL